MRVIPKGAGAEKVQAQERRVAAREAIRVKVMANRDKAKPKKVNNG
jgi:hypothetical protein